jgi:hypothetical protein
MIRTQNETETMSLESIKQELTDLLAHLLQIGRDSPELLMFLGQLIISDDWSEVTNFLLCQSLPS